MVVNYCGKKFYYIGPRCQFLPPVANVIKLFTAVIYCRSTVIPSFCVIKWNYYGNYRGMLVSNTMVIYLRKSRYCSKLPGYFYNTGQKYHSILTPQKGGTTVNYHSIFTTLAPVGGRVLAHVFQILFTKKSDNCK